MAAACLLTGIAVHAACAAPTANDSSVIGVEETGGVWSFVAPDQTPFLSLGVNCVLPGPSREEYDSTKPAYAAFRYYDTNKKWCDDTVRRLKSWNFNTVGGWSDPALLQGQMPYVQVLHLGAQMGVPWNDLFADEFAEKMNEIAVPAIEPLRGDPQLLGWCTDNELGWYPDTIFLFHLRQPPASRTRRRLIQLLKDHYENDFAALRRDFASPDADDFDELMAGGELRQVPGAAGRRVILEFTRLVAERYYQVVHAAIRRLDAKHLILGDRYVSFCPDPVVQAAAPYVDVVTTNYDWPNGTDGYLPLQYLRRLHELSKKPVLITEYYVAAHENGSNNPNSGNIFTTVETQQERAAALETRLRRLIEEPYVVGAHWFCYADEPPGGRPKDGEDYNFGLVDIENRPYQELTAAFTDLNHRAMALHANSVAALGPKIEGKSAAKVPRARGETMNGIAEWDKRGAIAPHSLASGGADLLTCWDDQHVYVAVMGLRHLDHQLYSQPDIPPSELLNLSVHPAGMKTPVCIRFGEGTEVAVDRRGVECRAAHEGVRFTAIAAVPAAMFDRARLAPGDEIEFHAVLRDERDDTDTSWKAILQLE